MMPIEELGNNGGGYYNANTAHPYENPNPFTSILLSWLVVMVPFAFAVTFGKWVGSMRPGRRDPGLDGRPVRDRPRAHPASSRARATRS